MTDIVNKDYFEWLCNIVGGYSTHYFLLKRLFAREFYYIVDRDGNRAYDGTKLRSVFNKQLGYLDWAVQIVNGVQVDANLDTCCTVLEMLVGLALRCELDIMNDPEKGDRTKLWFWSMLDNLDISKYDDSSWDQEARDDVDHKIDIFVERRYKRNGVGGLFPLSGKRIRDQRKVDIWYQLNYWLNENYSLEEFKTES